jgi:hypothetical protein
MEPDPDLLSQMGFASFGASIQSKKRKFNPRADATSTASIEIQEREDSRRNQDKATGGNIIALGPRKPRVPHMAEPSIDQGEGTIREISDEGPTYTDGTPPAVDEANESMGVASENVTSSTLVPTRIDKDAVTFIPPSSDTRVSQSVLPIQRPKSPIIHGGMTRSELAAYRRGVRNDRGDMVYYDSSFIEDPWAHLEGPAAAAHK